jgi:hypothetical protein
VGVGVDLLEGSDLHPLVPDDQPVTVKMENLDPISATKKITGQNYFLNSSDPFTFSQPALRKADSLSSPDGQGSVTGNSQSLAEIDCSCSDQPQHCCADRFAAN